MELDVEETSETKMARQLPLNEVKKQSEIQIERWKELFLELAEQEWMAFMTFMTSL